ncbi:MAG: hypothetical protein ABJF04_17250 [Reichenbachiella sp.]|uniref:hypothetical protein n=1 Tax=Reichenbachiella sp. TaxID=2184521 RepID=UPI003263EC62
MQKEEKIKQINAVINDYFENVTKENLVAAKNLMPYFIKVGIFVKDRSAGGPIRQILRELDEKNALDRIPFVHPVRKDKNTNWFFLRTGAIT